MLEACLRRARPALRAVCLLLLAAFAASPLWAATVTSRATGNWGSTTTWAMSRTGTITTSTGSATVNGAGTLFSTELGVNDIIMRASDNALIGTVKSVTSNTQLVLQANAAIALANQAYTVRKIPVANDIVTIASGHTVTLQTNTASLGSLTVNGILTMGNSGTARTLTVNGSLSVASGGTVQIANTDALHSVVVSGDITNNGTLDLYTSGTRAANVTFSGGSGTTQTVSGTGATTQFNNATAANANLVYKHSGTVSQNGTLTLTSGSLTVQSGTLDLNAAGTVTAGTVTVSGGTLDIGAGFTAGGATGVTGTVTLSSSSGTKSFNGNVTISGGGTWNNTSGVNAPVTFGANLTNNGTLNSTGTGLMTFSGGTLSGTNSISFGGPILANGALANNATLSVGGTATLAAGVVLTNSSTATISGDIVGGSGTSKWVNAENSRLNAGNAVLGTGILDASASGNTVNYNRAGDQSIKLPSGSPGTYHHLELNGTGTKTFPGTAVTVAGNLTLAATGTLTGQASEALTVNGNTTLGASTTFNASSYTHNLKGNFTNSGTFTANTSTVNLNGTSAQTVGGANSTSFNNLTVNNAAGIVLSGVNATVNGVLDFASGNVTTGANKVILPSGASATRTSGHVIGNLQKYFGGFGANQDFEVGDANGYAPIKVTFSIGALGNLTATTGSGEHPDIAGSGIDSQRDINRYWVLTDSGIFFLGSYTAQLTYINGTPVDRDASATPGSFVVARGDSCNASLQSCTWSYPSLSGTPTSTTATATGLSQFGSFVVGERAVANFLVEAAGGGSIGNQSQGVAFAIRITARDAGNNTITTFTGTVDITSTCTLSAGGGTTASFAGGILASHSVTVSSAGTCTITATQTGGTATGTSNSFVVAASVASFNAVETGASPSTGKLLTKVAGRAFGLTSPQTVDIVALDGGGSLATGFTGTVKLEVVDNSGGGACAGLPVIASFTDQTFVSGDAGRHALTLQSAVPNVWKNAKIRISYPTTSPTVMSCSGDNFAIRPATLTVTVSHGTRTTPGSIALDNKSTSNSATVHNAGRPFTISARADNDVGVETSNYDGTPTVALGTCSGGDACLAPGGSLSISTWSGTGTVTTNDATYSEVGAFTVTLTDDTFAAVDASDAGAQYAFSSSTVDAGRFVPDHFTVAYNTPQFSTACAGGVTYVGQTIAYGTAPVVTFTARNAAGAATALYSGTLFRVTSVSLTGKAYSAASGTLDTTGAPGTDPAIAATGGGTGTLTFGSGTGFFFARAALVAPFDAEISLAINLIDADGAAYGTNPARFGQASAGMGIAFTDGNAGTTTDKQMRYGRLFMSNSYGSEHLDLRVPVEAQYWDGSKWLRNTLDSCTSLAASNLAIGNYLGGLNGTNLGSSHLSMGAFSQGIGHITVGKPTPAATGAAYLAFNLGNAASASTCSGAWTATATGAQAAYLRGNWCGAAHDKDPEIRIDLGVIRNRFIYRRESY